VLVTCIGILKEEERLKREELEKIMAENERKMKEAQQKLVRCYSNMCSSLSFCW